VYYCSSYAGSSTVLF
nr:immunoglobulin light chain junction region [Macaca mulatta]MOW68662.1 immunoglobulin light chain junction region [Macaca mulatta]MOW68871.1 immunoglobulin light chain junction region [Macaca mulatta]MOW69890.1 immunoglobulin light chain junction region [Macaca mulatta]MOW70760.1 immunoglobulin light chain junction region [Macaca mulatta]